MRRTRCWIALLAATPLLTLVPADVAQAAAAPASSITVTPRSIPADGSTVVVSGAATPGDSVWVSVGSLTQSLGGVGESGLFSSEPFDVAAEPRTLVPVSVRTRDGSGDTTTSAGSVDNRLFSSISSLRLSPTSIPYGTTTQVLGRLARTDGLTALAARGVALYEVRDNGTEVGLARTISNQDGSFLFTALLAASGRLKVVYSGDANQRAAVSPLSTRVAVGASSYPADHPGTLAGGRAAAAAPQGRALEDRLASSTDVDVFSFGVPSGGIHRIVLGHLPVNAMLELFDRNGHLIARSDQGGVRFEELVRYLSAGTYLVRVRSGSGAASSTPYHLSFSRVADGVVFLSRRVGSAPTSDGTYAAITGELFNSSNRDREPGIRVRCVLPSGSTTARNDYLVGFPLRAHTRRPIGVTVRPCPSGTSMQLDLRSDVVAFAPRPAVTISVGPGLADRFGRHYPYAVRNDADRSTGPFSVFVVEYDTEGRMQGFVQAYQQSLGPHASRRGTSDDVITTAPYPNTVRGVLGVS